MRMSTLRTGSFWARNETRAGDATFGLNGEALATALASIPIVARQTVGREIRSNP